MKPLLISYASAGNGHRSAAKAVSEALECIGRLSVVADVLDFADPLFRKIYSDVYQIAGEHSHSVCRAMYRITDTARDNNAFVRLIDRISMSKTSPFIRFVRENNPGSFLATHFLPMSVLAWMKGNGLYSGSIFATVTDFDLHNMWLSDWVDGYFVANDEIALKLLDNGVPINRIVVSGIPVRMIITEGAIRIKKHVTSPLSVLFIASSIADDKAIQIIEMILSLPKKVNLKVICGRNESLLKSIEDRLGSGRTDLDLLGFTEDIQNHYYEADLLITKPGGLTIAESLCFALPMVFVHPIPYQETRNAEYIQKKGAGWLVPDTSNLGSMIEMFSSDRWVLQKARKACLNIARPEASRIIAHEVVRRSISQYKLGKEEVNAIRATGTRQ